MIHIYTDGSSLVNKKGSWAYVIVRDGVIIAEKFGYAPKTHNNEMEFIAALNAVKDYPTEEFTLCSDSKILIDSLTQHLPVWTPDLLPFFQMKLTQEIYSFAKTRKHLFKWIKGHGSNVFNQRADRLCRNVLGLK